MSNLKVTPRHCLMHWSNKIPALMQPELAGTCKFIDTDKSSANACWGRLNGICVICSIILFDDDQLLDQLLKWMHGTTTLTRFITQHKPQLIKFKMRALRRSVKLTTTLTETASTCASTAGSEVFCSQRAPTWTDTKSSADPSLIMKNKLSPIWHRWADLPYHSSLSLILIIFCFSVTEHWLLDLPSRLVKIFNVLKLANLPNWDFPIKNSFHFNKPKIVCRKYFSHQWNSILSFSYLITRNSWIGLIILSEVFPVWRLDIWGYRNAIRSFSAYCEKSCGLLRVVKMKKLLLLFVLVALAKVFVKLFALLDSSLLTLLNHFQDSITKHGTRRLSTRASPTDRELLRLHDVGVSRNQRFAIEPFEDFEWCWPAGDHWR